MMKRLASALCFLVMGGCSALSPAPTTAVCSCPAPVAVAPPPIAAQAMVVQPQVQTMLVPSSPIQHHRLGLGIFELAIPVPFPNLTSYVEQPAPQVVTQVVQPQCVQPQYVQPQVFMQPMTCSCSPAATLAPPIAQPVAPPLAGNPLPPIQPSVTTADLCKIAESLQKAAKSLQDAGNCGGKP